MVSGPSAPDGAQRDSNISGSRLNHNLSIATGRAISQAEGARFGDNCFDNRCGGSGNAVFVPGRGENQPRQAVSPIFLPPELETNELRAIHQKIDALKARELVLDATRPRDLLQRRDDKQKLAEEIREREEAYEKERERVSHGIKPIESRR
jgi:hypothetical protein